MSGENALGGSRQGPWCTAEKVAEFRACCRQPAETGSGSSGAARRIADAATGALRSGGLDDAAVAQAFAASQFLLTGWLALRSVGDRGEGHPALVAAGVRTPSARTTAVLETSLRRLLAGFRHGGGPRDGAAAFTASSPPR